MADAWDWCACCVAEVAADASLPFIPRRLPLIEVDAGVEPKLLSGVWEAVVEPEECPDCI